MMGEVVGVELRLLSRGTWSLACADLLLAEGDPHLQPGFLFWKSYKGQT
jgi:hypothetical protein